MKPRVLVRRLPGFLPYAEAQRLQHSLLARRREGLVPDTLLLLQHLPVFTLGRLQKESASNLRVGMAEVAAAGANVVQSDRGGNITFHGPGQLVAYPILDLNGFRRDLRWFVSALEDTMIGTAAAFGVEAQRGGPGSTGVWVEERKIGAIGVRVKRWLSCHGVALNADVDLDFFQMIVPCGLHETPRVTSMTRECGRKIGVDEVVPHFEDAFAHAFECELQHEPQLSGGAGGSSQDAIFREVIAARAIAAARGGRDVT